MFLSAQATLHAKQYCLVQCHDYSRKIILREKNKQITYFRKIMDFSLGSKKNRNHFITQ